jgi:hypothetical protein
MSRMTPLGECVDLCLKNVTTHNILHVVKGIESGLLGAGLPTLLQSAWAVTSLSRGAAIEILQGKPATTLTLSLLNVMTRQHGNASAYKELCTAVAAIAAFASDKLWSLKILPLVHDGYFAGEEPARYFAGLLMLALSSDNRSSEVLRRRIKVCICRCSYLCSHSLFFRRTALRWCLSASTTRRSACARPLARCLWALARPRPWLCTTRRFWR